MRGIRNVTSVQLSHDAVGDGGHPQVPVGGGGLGHDGSVNVGYPPIAWRSCATVRIAIVSRLSLSFFT
jgi:hypothetical protein